MPKYKGSCGCYNREDARELGLATAVVWNDILDRSEHFDSNPMWYDQKMASERLGIPNQTISRCIKTLEEVGRIKADGGYRPKSTIRTTWITVVNEGLGENLIPQNGEPKVPQNGETILYETEKRDSGQDLPVVVFLRVNPSGKAWKSQRVYSTQEEVDRLEESDPDDTIDFKYWKSPKMVGDDSRAKFKRTKAKLIQPDIQDEPEEVNQIEGLEHFVKFGDM